MLGGAQGLSGRRGAFWLPLALAALLPPPCPAQPPPPPVPPAHAPPPAPVAEAVLSLPRLLEIAAAHHPDLAAAVARAEAARGQLVQAGLRLNPFVVLGSE